jgi:hypothetical protein
MPSQLQRIADSMQRILAAQSNGDSNMPSDQPCIDQARAAARDQTSTNLSAGEARIKSPTQVPPLSKGSVRNPPLNGPKK